MERQTEWQADPLQAQQAGKVTCTTTGTRAIGRRATRWLRGRQSGWHSRVYNSRPAEEWLTGTTGREAGKLAEVAGSIAQNQAGRGVTGTTDRHKNRQSGRYSSVAQQQAGRGVTVTTDRHKNRQLQTVR
jgi:hypothetical protein